MYHISLNFNCEIQVFGRKFPPGRSRRTAPFNPRAELLCDVEGRTCQDSCTAMVAALAPGFATGMGEPLPATQKTKCKSRFQSAHRCGIPAARAEIKEGTEVWQKNLIQLACRLDSSRSGGKNMTKNIQPLITLT